MKTTIGGNVIELVLGDITEQDTDAIVNAANCSLLGGGGVDGAIHRRGGPAILEQCRRLNGCKTGDAKITTAGKLHSKFVIHTVGPVYRNGSNNESELLASAYRRSLEVAAENEVNSISFPSISTGVYSYPVVEAANIALYTVIEYLKRHRRPELVKFVLFDSVTYEAYNQVLDRLSAEI